MYRNAATHPGKPINSTVTILNEDFVIAGEIMVFSILHGGAAPSFLDPIVYKFLAKLPLQVDDCSPSQLLGKYVLLTCWVIPILEIRSILYLTPRHAFLMIIYVLYTCFHFLTLDSRSTR